jgi:MFS family permease
MTTPHVFASTLYADLRWGLRAFSSRNYRLYFLGQSCSVIGLWMSFVATMWVVYDLTHSSLLLGVVGFVTRIPAFCLTPFVGVWVDRCSRYQLVWATQSLRMLLALALAVLVLTGQITVPLLLLISLLQGLIVAVDIPSRHALLVELVNGSDHLRSAIALNSSMFSAARLIGPALAGILIAHLGAGICYLLDCLSYLALLGAMAAIQLTPPLRVPSQKTPWQDFVAGLQYASGSLPMRAVFIGLGLASFMGMPYPTLAPIMAQDILGGGPETLGWLMSSSGSGALLAAFYLATRRQVAGLGAVMAWSQGLLGLCLLLFAHSQMLWLSLLSTAGIGATLILQTAACNTWLQTYVEEDKRGRIMSLYTMAFVGMIPFGTLWTGYLGEHWGAPAALGLCGGFCLLGSGVLVRLLPQIEQRRLTPAIKTP